MKEIMATGSQLQGDNIEASILWQPDIAFGQVISPERGGRVRGVGFSPTPYGNRASSIDDSTPTPTSTTTDQRIKELFAQVEAMREKFTRYDAIEAEVRLMWRMLTQLHPSFPTISMVRSLNYKVCCVSYLLDICMCMFSIKAIYWEAIDFVFSFMDKKAS